MNEEGSSLLFYCYAAHITPWFDMLYGNSRTQANGSGGNIEWPEPYYTVAYSSYTNLYP